MKKFFLLMMALCLALSVSMALADQTLEGDANVDQRNYPSTAPFIHPPFYNVKLAVTVDDSGVITAVTDNGTGAAGSVQEGNEDFWANKNKPYFDAAVNGGLLDKFVGKTLEEVRAMDMTSGRGLRVVYFDCRDELGTFIEVNAPLTQLYEGIKAMHENWDDSRPLRPIAELMGK